MFQLMIFTGLLVTVVILGSGIGRRFIKKSEQALDNCEKRFLDRFPVLFYFAVIELIEKCSLFKDSEEVKKTYKSLLELKARYEPFKKGLNEFKKMQGIIIDQIKMCDKKIAKHNIECKNKNADNDFLANRRKVLLAEGAELKEKDVFYKKASIEYVRVPVYKDIDELKNARNVLNSCFLKLQEENAMLRNESTRIIEKNRNLAESVRKITELKNKLNIDIDELQKQNKDFYAVMDKIKGDNTKMKKDIEAMNMLHYELNIELQKIVEENRKLTEATADWEYI